MSAPGVVGTVRAVCGSVASHGRRGRTLAAAVLALLATLLLGAAPARAALFEDSDARRALLELRERVTSGETQAQQLREQNARLAEQVQQLQRSLLDMSNQLEAARRDVAQLRGTSEEHGRDIGELQRRQKDIAQGVEERMRKVEPQKVSLDGLEFGAEPDEKRQFETAMSTMRASQFDKAVTEFQAFAKRWPSSGYLPSARFWLGNAQYAQRDYKGAIESFRALQAAAPNHARVPESMLAIANSQAESKDPKAARRTLEELVQRYPQSEAAQAARERLAAAGGSGTSGSAGSAGSSGSSGTRADSPRPRR